MTNTTKYYFEDGTAEEECECRTDRDSIVVVNSVVRIHRSATDGRTDVWECTADHAMTNPPPTTSGCLDRVWECANKLSNVPIACGVVQLEIFYNNTRQRIGLMARRDADAMIVIGALTTAHSVPTGSDNPAVLVMDNCVRAPLGYHIACEYEILSYDCRRPPTVAFRSRLEKHGPSFGEDDTDTRRNILILTMAMDTKTGTLAFLIKPTPKPEAPRSQTAQPTSKTVTTYADDRAGHHTDDRVDHDVRRNASDRTHRNTGGGSTKKLVLRQKRCAARMQMAIRHAVERFVWLADAYTPQRDRRSGRNLDALCECAGAVDPGHGSFGSRLGV